MKKYFLGFVSLFILGCFLIGASNVSAQAQRTVKITPKPGPSKIVSWNASNGATSYDLQAVAGTDFSKLVDPATPKAILCPTSCDLGIFANMPAIKTNSYSIPNLTVGTQYSWRVRAVNAFGRSSWSTASSFKADASVNLNTGASFQPKIKNPLNTLAKQGMKVPTSLAFGAKNADVKNLKSVLSALKYLPSGTINLAKGTGTATFDANLKKSLGNFQYKNKIITSLNSPNFGSYGPVTAAYINNALSYSLTSTGSQTSSAPSGSGSGGMPPPGGGGGGGGAPMSNQCMPPPSQMISWYDGTTNGSGNFYDVKGNYSSTLNSGVSTANSMVGMSAMAFDGTTFAQNNSYWAWGTYSNTKMSVDYWVMPDSTLGTGVLSGVQDHVCYGGFWCAQSDGAKIKFSLNNGSVLSPNFTYASRTNANVLTDGVWTHVALVWDGSISSAKIYIDGALVPSTVVMGTVPLQMNQFCPSGLPNGCGLRIGKFLNGFVGNLDEIELFKKALTPTEIFDLYDAQSAGKCRGTANAVGGPTTDALTMKTEDTGANWTYQTNPSTGTPFLESYNGVSFVDPNTGWTVGTDLGSNSGRIMKTTNGGSSWSFQTLYGSNTFTLGLNDVYFTDMQNGWAVGDGLRMFKTTDGGTNWVDMPLVGPGLAIPSYAVATPLRGVFFLTSSIGFVVSDLGLIFKTTDGGTNWYLVYTNSTMTNLEDVFFLDTNTGYVVGWNGLMLKTINGGTTWTPMTHSVTCVVTGASNCIRFRAINFVSPNEGWVVGGRGGAVDPVIIHTINGGTTWTQQTPPAGSGELWGVSFKDPQIGVAVGASTVVTGTGSFIGAIYTSNGGATWAQSATNNKSLWDVVMP